MQSILIDLEISWEAMTPLFLHIPSPGTETAVTVTLCQCVRSGVGTRKTACFLVCKCLGREVDHNQNLSIPDSDGDILQCNGFKLLGCDYILYVDACEVLEIKGQICLKECPRYLNLAKYYYLGVVTLCGTKGSGNVANDLNMGRLSRTVQKDLECNHVFFEEGDRGRETFKIQKRNVAGWGDG